MDTLLPPSRLQLAGPLRWALPVTLVLLFLAVLLWLPWQARQMESNERQEQLIADTLWVEQAIRFELDRNAESLENLGAEIAVGGIEPAAVQARLDQMRKVARELTRVAWLDEAGQVRASSGTPVATTPASREAALLAHQTGNGRYSRPASAGGAGAQMDYHLPITRDGFHAGSLVVSYDLDALLDETVPWWFAQDNAVALLDADDKVVARRESAGPGRGVYTHNRPLDLNGAELLLATNSVKAAPRLLPNLLVGSVVLLALGLLASLAALWRDVTRRLAAEGALRQQMAFRTAMENSMVTGLRARDLEGRITYVNPAFCRMVGLTEAELVGRAPPMPYWAPEVIGEYQQRFAEVLSGNVTPQFETVFQRADGQRIPVLIFEAPLIGADGQHTGWMGSILDISERKHAEELHRQQQEKLQASSRLATMGEISSMLAHELNQPLAAISSYTSGALNMLSGDGGKPVDADTLRPALEQAGLQAQRAGQIIRSVHQFVKKRDPVRQLVEIPAVIEGVRELMELQARRFYVAVQIHADPALPPVRADRMMLEQVLLNLTRNGVEAMQDIAPERRILRIEARAANGRVEVSVIDNGHGIPDDVNARLYSPFFTTKAEGMGMGLSICRTAIEFHGGTLNHRPNPGGGTVFTFSLPAEVGVA
ncbi:sensor histidine kinase [Massilia sp. GCM10020059]|uniref:histidine kinase n=1 Tax=Massilia agrisoli TaxID=2892444 RepID=A0ABS8IY26_9BURK|nr:PAS domain-containing sensor histidine kinase [Massilia agrisoli]MCC6073416.1 PAS domain S-box protein [Massilia agrisoli]